MPGDTRDAALVWPTRWTPWSLLVSAFGYAVAMDKDAQSYEGWCAKRDALAREVAEMLEKHFREQSRTPPAGPVDGVTMWVARDANGRVSLYLDKPDWSANLGAGGVWFGASDWQRTILGESIAPSLNLAPGECAAVRLVRVDQEEGANGR